jgi:hypothetical protein
MEWIMKAVLERLEYTWWGLHIRLLDESVLIQKVLPKIKVAWERREEVMPYLVLSILGFPIGVLLGFIAAYYN